MKLTVELVPSTVWNSSLYRLLPAEVWSKMREDIIREKGRKCQICGETKGAMNLHEIWIYNDVSHIQKLEGFILLCTMCHHVKHIGKAGLFAKEGKLDYSEVENHFCKVKSSEQERKKEGSFSHSPSYGLYVADQLPEALGVLK